MKRKLCALLVATLGLSASVGFAGCDMMDMDFEDAYNEALNSIYDTYTQDDGKIALPTAGSTYSYQYNSTSSKVVVRLDKTEYVTQVLKSAGLVSTEIKAYFTVVSGEGDFAIVGKLYDAENYKLDEQNEWVESDVAAGEKFVLSFYYSLDEMTEANYKAGGYRFALASYTN